MTSGPALLDRLHPCVQRIDEYALKGQGLSSLMENLIPITRFGDLKPLRNIRAFLDETTLVLDLIPEFVSETTYVPTTDDLATPVSARLLTGSSEVVESKTMLRLRFDQIRSSAFSNEFCDIHPVSLDTPQKDWPHIQGTQFTYPLVEVLNSNWHAGLPDYQNGGANGGMHHFRAISAVSIVDIVGFEPSFEWLPNPHFA